MLEDSKLASEAVEASGKDKVSPGGVVLVPTPSDDPHDPLNWPAWRKNLQFAILCFGTFVGICAATSPALATVAQAKTFHTTPNVVSYTLSGTVGGLLVGPLIFIPLARVFGMCSISFWTLALTAAFCAWAGAANGRDDFISHAVARGLTGVVCPITQILTSGFIVNVYFRHQRGVAFAIYSTIYTLGTVAGGTLCGFIVQHTSWPVNFWWLVAGNGLAAVLVFLFLEETAFERDENGNQELLALQQRRKSMSWLQSRIETFLPGYRVVPRVSFGQTLTYFSSTFAIGISPSTILAGIYAMVNFAWLVIITIELPIVLQTPSMPGAPMSGYGFSPQSTAIFLFAFWIGILLAQAWGVLVNDRIPMSLARRSGSFKPEYRLYPAYFPGLVVAPIGLGLVGASLQYHLHFMVLAVGAGLVSFGAVASVPVSINYVVESFRPFPQEVGAAMNTWRLVLALPIPFFYEAWAEAVTIGWLYGMAAFFSIFAFLLVMLLMWQGPKIRTLSLLKSAS